MVSLRPVWTVWRECEEKKRGGMGSLPKTSVVEFQVGARCSPAEAQGSSPQPGFIFMETHCAGNSERWQMRMCLL